MKKFFSLTALALSLAGTLALSPLRADEAPKTETTEVRVCPMAGKAVKGDGAASTTFKNYKVFFCCGGCKGKFEKLSDDEKQAKIDAALKKQNEAPKE